MGEDAPLDGYVVLETLASEPGEVDGGVYTDGFEDSAGVAGGWEFGLVEDAELIWSIFALLIIGDAGTACRYDNPDHSKEQRFDHATGIDRKTSLCRVL